MDEVNFRNYCMQQNEQTLLDMARKRQLEDQKTNPYAKAYANRNEWYCMKTDENIPITDGLNTVEAMGFSVVNVLPAGFNNMYIFGRRTVRLELPEEVPSVDGETVTTELPSLVTDEAARKAWEESESKP
jgi:hypothetical protein